MIMVAEINADDVFYVSTSKTIGVKKVDPVEVTKSLPESGNALPVTRNETDPMNKNIDDAVIELNENLQMLQRELQFTVDNDSGKTVIKVIDMQTKELIRQIPNEEAIKVAQQLNEGLNPEIFDSYT
jgi:flagellar protein FlaG